MHGFGCRSTSVLIVSLLFLCAHAWYPPASVRAASRNEEINSPNADVQQDAQEAGNPVAPAGVVFETAVSPPLAISRARLEPRSFYTRSVPDDLASESGRWIEVDLSDQRVIAYEGTRPVRIFTVSTGLPRWPTVTGTFHIRTKTSSQTMSGGSRAGGDYYNLPNVKWVQYFYEDYSFHGTYWHNNFGRPMSHGCVNMTNEDAEWLFFWAGPRWDGNDWLRPTPDNPGTTVVIHD